MAKKANTSPITITRYVLFEKVGVSCPQLEETFYEVLRLCQIKHDEIRFPKSVLYIFQNKVAFEHDYGREIFKVNTVLWDAMLLYFEGYEKSQKFTNKLIYKYLGLKNCEIRPLRSILVSMLDTEMWQLAKASEERHRKNQALKKI